MDMAQGFRDELNRLLLSGDWTGWEQTCLIFADYLEEHGSAEALMARSPWRLHVPKRNLKNTSKSWFHTLHTTLPRPINITRLDRLVGAHNTRWYLGFAPYTLKLRVLSSGFRGRSEGIDRTCPGGATFTWVPNRVRSRWHKVETTYFKEGLLELWLPPPEPATFMPLFPMYAPREKP